MNEAVGGSERGPGFFPLKLRWEEKKLATSENRHSNISLQHKKTLAMPSMAEHNMKHKI